MAHSTGGGGTRSEFLESKGPARCPGRMRSQGASGGQGPGQEWTEGGAQVGPGGHLNETEFLLPAGGGSLLRLLPPALTPCPRPWRGRGDVSTGPCPPGSRCRRWSMASRTSPAPSATAPLCASWPLAPAPEPSSCILSVLPAPTQGCPGRARGLGIGEIQEGLPQLSIEKQVADDPSCSRDVPNTLLGVSPECSKWRPGMGPTSKGSVDWAQGSVQTRDGVALG